MVDCLSLNREILGTIPAWAPCCVFKNTWSLSSFQTLILKNCGLGRQTSTSTSTSTSYSQQSISDYYLEALSGTAMKMMKMGDVKA